MKKHGFTLIEALIILAIIGLIGLIVLPAFKNVGGAANKSTRSGIYYKEYDGGHSWVIRKPYYGNENSSSMTHDPDCDCFKNNSIEKE